MNNFVLEPTATAQLQKLVQEGASLYGHDIDENSEHYLVSTLERTLGDQNLLNYIIASKYLESMQDVKNTTDLRNVGDRCLIFAGLFPGLAIKKLVRISYFVHMGKSAYQELGNRISEKLYAHLAREFVPLMDTLQGMRDISGMNPMTLIEESELWEDCRSKRAYCRLTRLGAFLGPNSRDVH